MWGHTYSVTKLRKCVESGPMKKNDPNKLFDEHRQTSERGGARNGDIEETLLKDARETAKIEEVKTKAKERRRVYQCIQKFPGISEIELREIVGPTVGLTEWLRDGIVAKRNGRLYAA